jgi:hypothetical protein
MILQPPYTKEGKNAKGHTEDSGEDDRAPPRGEAAHATKSKSQKKKEKMRRRSEVNARNGERGTQLPTAEGTSPHHTRMECNTHKVACAIRAGASLMLYELLCFEFSPPWLEVCVFLPQK